METAMSDLLDEYPMLIFALESLLALSLLIFIVVWTASGKKKVAREEREKQQRLLKTADPQREAAQAAQAAQAPQGANAAQSARTTQQPRQPH
jgi:hypothetical protein